MQLSVIIPVRDRPQEIARCVTSIQAAASSASLTPSDYEILVVDNGSSTSVTASAASSGGARVLSEPIANRCRARNRGAAEARGAWLIFTDSDCVANINWIAAFQAAIQNAEPQTAAIAGAICNPPAETMNPVEAYIAERRWIDQEKFLATNSPLLRPFAATANLAIRRDVFLPLGGFDESLSTAGEDADFCWRLADAGRAITYAPAAIVTHHHRATLRGMLRQAFHYGIGNADLFAKWHSARGVGCWFEPRLYIWSLKGFLKWPIAAMTGALMGRPPLARRIALYDGLANLAQAMGRLRGGLLRRRPVA